MNQKQENLICALYGRVSTEEQKEGQNIDSQMHELRKYSQENGYIIAKEYKDDGWSGGLLARPALDELRDDATKGLFQAVIVNDVDRLARDVSHIGVIKRDLEKNGIQLIFRKLPVGNSPTDNLMINMLGSFAEFEREVIADRTRRGRRYKAEIKKIIVGHTSPYGFKYIKKDKDKGLEGRYEINDSEASIVKKIFELVDSKHYTAHDLSKWLFENKIITRKGSKKWSISSICRILRRTDYIGLAYYNKLQSIEPIKPRGEVKYRKQKKSSRKFKNKDEWIPIPIPECKIIDEDRFNRVQELLNQNKVFSKRNSKNNYLLSGLIYCSCSSRYAGEPQHGKPFYRCRNRINNFPLPRTCHNGSILAKTLDEAVWDAVSDALQKPSLITSKLEKIDKYHKNRSRKASVEVEALKKQLESTKNEENRVFTLYKEGLISIAKYKEETNLIKEKQIKYQKELSVLDSQNLIPKQYIKRSVRYYANLVKSSLKKLENNFEIRQRLIRLIIQKGVINGRDLELNCAIQLISEPKFGIVFPTLKN